MAQKVMYPVKTKTPTKLTSGITQTDTRIDLENISEYLLDPAPNLVHIKSGTSLWERCRYTAVVPTTGNAGYLTIERSGVYHGSSANGSALAWGVGATVYRGLGEYEINSLQDNIGDHETRINSLQSRFENSGVVYGLLWNRASSSPSLQRIDENGDILTLTSTNFDNHPLWGGMKRCSLTAAGVASYGTNNRGDGLTLTNDYVMVEIPLAYAGAYREGDYQGILLSDQPFSSKYCSSERHPAFWRRDRSGTRATKLYLGAYEAGANGGTTVANGESNTLYATSRTGLKLTSKSGVKCLTGSGTDGTMAQMEASANAIGTGWGIESYWSRALIQALLYIEHGTFNSQSAIGPGRTNASNTAALDTGGANALMNTVGTGGGTDLQAVAYRGIENLWGNIWEFIIGLNVVDAEIRVMKKDGTGALADTLTDYQATSGIIPLNGSTNLGGGTDAGAYTHGYAKDLLFADPLKLGFFPSGLGGSESTYLTDYYYSHQDTLTNILLAGGAWGLAGRAGVGCLGAHGAAALVGPDGGARLELIL